MIFALILMISTLITGLIYFFDLFFKPSNQNNNKVLLKVINVAKEFFPILLLVFVIRTFVVEPFKIPSGSMMPTLIAGDFIAVNKFSYGLRLPVFNKLIFQIASPQRGDVFVFHYPKDLSIDYIKRVIGLPGDKIRYENKKLFVNDIAVSQTYTSIYKYSLKQDLEVSAKEFVEDHEDYSHSILIHDIPSESVEFVVPDGHYFAMGDNRDNSSDSRVWGFVPDELLVGKAFVIWLNFSEPNRIGNWIN
jgi:signal peptidase I